MWANGSAHMSRARLIVISFLCPAYTAHYMVQAAGCSTARLITVTERQGDILSVWYLGTPVVLVSH